MFHETFAFLSQHSQLFMICCHCDPVFSMTKCHVVPTVSKRSGTHSFELGRHGGAAQGLVWPAVAVVNSDPTE